jgi:hypothetical protein
VLLELRIGGAPLVEEVPDPLDVPLELGEAGVDLSKLRPDVTDRLRRRRFTRKSAWAIARCRKERTRMGRETESIRWKSRRARRTVRSF